MNVKTDNTEHYEFHQFVRIEKGPHNTAIIDFLTGDLYQLENIFIEKFKANRYHEIPEFLQSLKDANLIIAVPPQSWIPKVLPKNQTPTNKDYQPPLTLEIEEPISPASLSALFENIKIREIYYFGTNPPASPFPGVPLQQREKNYSKCSSAADVSEDFDGINESEYAFNMVYNSCWGGKVAFTADGSVRPCIYSQKTLGNISQFKSGEDIIAACRDTWELTKDKIKKCKVCELRYACFDCRELALRTGKGVDSPNPTCQYNPHTGKW